MSLTGPRRPPLLTCQTTTFVSGAEIDLDVISNDVCRYLGNNAICKPESYIDPKTGQFTQSYCVIAERALKEDEVAHLTDTTRLWRNEKLQSHEAREIGYANSQTRKTRWVVTRIKDADSTLEHTVYEKSDISGSGGEITSHVNLNGENEREPKERAERAMYSVLGEDDDSANDVRYRRRYNNTTGHAYDRYIEFSGNGQKPGSSLDRDGRSHFYDSIDEDGNRTDEETDDDGDPQQIKRKQSKLEDHERTGRHQLQGIRQITRSVGSTEAMDAQKYKVGDSTSSHPKAQDVNLARTNPSSEHDIKKPSQTLSTTQPRSPKGLSNVKEAQIPRQKDNPPVQANTGARRDVLFETDKISRRAHQSQTPKLPDSSSANPGPNPSQVASSQATQHIARAAKVGISDTVNWAIAAPATVAALGTGAVAGYSVHLQKKGTTSQNDQLTAAENLHLTMLRMEQQLRLVTAKLAEMPPAPSGIIPRSGGSGNCSPDLGNGGSDYDSFATTAVNRVGCNDDDDVSVKPCSASQISSPVPDNTSCYTLEEHLPDDVKGGSGGDSFRLSTLHTDTDMPRSRKQDTDVLRDRKMHLTYGGVEAKAVKQSYELTEEDLQLIRNWYEEGYGGLWITTGQTL